MCAGLLRARLCVCACVRVCVCACVHAIQWAAGCCARRPRTVVQFEYPEHVCTRVCVRVGARMRA